MRLVRHSARRRIAFWALAAVGLLISHDAVWLIQLGPGEPLAAALRGGAHGYWAAVSGGLAVVGLVTAAVVASRIWTLRRRAMTVGMGGRPIRSTPYAARAASAWVRLLPVVAIGFVLQENVEHAFGHGHLPGLAALVGPEYPLALPVIAAITLLGALVAGAVLTVEDELLATIRAGQRRLRAPRRLVRPMRSAVVRSAATPRAHAGRAPPPLLVPV